MNLESPAPTSDVLEGFGIHECAVRLEGGLHGAFRAGQYVFKRVDDASYHDWLCETVLNTDILGLRLQKPLRTLSGSWTIYGWCAYEYITGRKAESRLAEKIEVARILHRSLKSLERDSCLSNKGGPWGRAERMVWQEEAIPDDLPSLVRNIIMNIPNPNPSFSKDPQLVDLDLCDNILFDPMLQPGVIDVTLSFRPCNFAEAILVYDSVVWNFGELSIAKQWLVDDSNVAELKRAAAFRLIVTALLSPPEECERNVECELKRAVSLLGRTVVGAEL